MSDELRKIATEPIRGRPFVSIWFVICFAITAVAVIVLVTAFVVGLGWEGY